ncbi:MAG: acylphosphatase [Chloroflexaceae bacterium]|nr:acylphosphatase [Chloroflexaceae bacterium]NJL33982.1 acylphosphatase [Chloroflexaceae bacterium]NJO05988.1 acylphosphatase [Chloroflexaceae bacterium]NJO84701.1 acylphosphatase [Blastochloris sp.]
MTTDRVSAHVFISGRVQGVNFRVYLRDQARQAGVFGWVRNLSDGRVEALLEGSNAGVRRVVSWCYSGPPRAEVDQVDVQWQSPEGQEDSFSILY